MSAVSVIIPCYNYARFVGFAIESCLDQGSRFKTEVIVVDDCSTDNSAEVIKRYEKFGVIYMKLNCNMGYSYAKNEGIVRSRSKYITTIDADDMLTPDSIKARGEFLDGFPTVDMVHGVALGFRGDHSYEFMKARMYKQKIKPRKKIHAQTVMVRREVYQKYGLYDEDLRSRSDNEMWHRLGDVAKIKIKEIETPVAFYRKHGNSMIDFRKKNKDYNNTVSEILQQKKALRMEEGITPENTRFLHT